MERDKDKNRETDRDRDRVSEIETQRQPGLDPNIVLCIVSVFVSKHVLKRNRPRSVVVKHV